MRPRIPSTILHHVLKSAELRLQFSLACSLARRIPPRGQNLTSCVGRGSERTQAAASEVASELKRQHFHFTSSPPSATDRLTEAEGTTYDARALKAAPRSTPCHPRFVVPFVDEQPISQQAKCSPASAGKANAVLPQVDYLQIIILLLLLPPPPPPPPPSLYAIRPI